MNRCGSTSTVRFLNGGGEGSKTSMATESKPEHQINKVRFSIQSGIQTQMPASAAKKVSFETSKGSEQ